MKSVEIGGEVVEVLRLELGEVDRYPGLPWSAIRRAPVVAGSAAGPARMCHIDMVLA